MSGFFSGWRAFRTCVCLINQHHPINLAKHVATLDHLSDGRFIFRIGAGWYPPEVAHHGVTFEKRSPQLRERLRARFVRYGQGAARARDLGAARASLRLPVADDATVLRRLDGYARLRA